MRWYKFQYNTYRTLGSTTTDHPFFLRTVLWITTEQPDVDDSEDDNLLRMIRSWVEMLLWIPRGRLSKPPGEEGLVGPLSSISSSSLNNSKLDGDRTMMCRLDIFVKSTKVSDFIIYVKHLNVRSSPRIPRRISCLSDN